MDTRHHPFWKKNRDFKYIYCFGIGVMSMGHMKSITETQQEFERLLRCIRLEQEDREQIFYDINNSFEQRIEEVFSHVRTKEEQYCFVLDLYQILGITSWAKPYCSQVLENYLQIFQLSAMERIFFQEFAKAKQEQDLEGARKAYQCLAEEGYCVRYDFLTWFYPEFSMEERYQDVVVPAGKTVLLDKPTRIIGNVFVERGGSLLIHGASLQMQGCVFVQGGRIQIDHGDIQVLSGRGTYWLNLEDTAVVTITDTVIDCHGCCGVLQQNTGLLLMEDSWFRNTAYQRAVTFSGQSICVKHTRFWDGGCGGIALKGAAHARLSKCEFKNVSAEYGGAVYSETIEDVLLEQSSFVNCRAKYLGSAVYFKHQKLGQNIKECRCSECVPEDSAFFNQIENGAYDSDR